MNSNAASGINSIGIAGNVIVPTRISFSGGLVFGNVTLGSIHTAILTIKNIGNRDLTISSINLPADFSANWANGMITAGDSQQVIVIFRPTVAQLYNEEITVLSDAINSPNNITVIGTGVEVLYTGVEDNQSNNFTFYPNPAINIITIEAITGEKINKVEVYTSTSKLIQSKTFNRKDSVKLELEQTVSSRIVLLKIYTNKGITVKKLIIAK